MSRQHALLAGALLLGSGLVTPALRAADAPESDDGGTASGPSPQDRALAEALFREGKQLGEAGEIAKACQKFKESQRLDPAIGTLLHLAACYEEEGRTASAWAAFNSAAERAERAKQKDRAELARARAGELEQKLSRLVIVVERPADEQTISLDGQELGEGALSTPLPVDPGKHELAVAAPGKRTWKQQIEIPDGPASETVQVPELEDAPSDEPAEVAPEPAPPPAPPPAPDQGSNTRTLGFVVGSVGLVGIAAGSYFGLRAASQADDADRYCRGRVCSQPGINGHDQAKASAMIANVLFGVGVAGLGVGAYLVFSSGGSTSPSARAAAPRSGVWLGAGLGQLTAGGRF